MINTNSNNKIIMIMIMVMMIFHRTWRSWYHILSYHLKLV